MSEENSFVIGVPKETFPGETRVGLVPGVLNLTRRMGAQIVMEAGAGLAAGFVDKEYEDKGARIASRDEVFAQADVIVQVRAYGANPDAGRADLEKFKQGQIVVALAEPLAEAQLAKEFSATGAKLFALELVPRITRAQSMDVLSSMATVAGYKAVLIAADNLPRMFPMMMTAAGTVSPAKVFVIGAGVAGLQAIATAKRLGARVEAFDTRPVVAEQVQSLGAKFVEIDLGDTGQTEQGYAKELTPEQIELQKAGQKKVISQSDVVITTAQVFGRPAPKIVSRDMVEAMAPGSVVVDMAVETGGNVEGSELDRVVDINGVKVVGQGNLPSEVAKNASEMYSNNLFNLIDHFWDDEAKELNLDPADEIVQSSVITRDGAIVNETIKNL